MLLPVASDTAPGTYPFGRPVEPVVQRDRAPKPIFILGVYASAVHARWFLPGTSRPVVQALAVASEPAIFWTGDEAEARQIIAGIPVPPSMGRLEPADGRYNGPSGRVLNEMILAPLGPQRWSRANAWLADIVPTTLLNDSQRDALSAHYDPFVAAGVAPSVTCRPAGRLAVDERRRREIACEIDDSSAKIIIILGDQPIRHFLRPLGAPWKRLSDLGATPESYGRRRRVTLQRWPGADAEVSREIEVVAVAHPRQIGGLGKTSRGPVDWAALHAHWMQQVAPTLLGDLS